MEDCVVCCAYDLFLYLLLDEYDCESDCGDSLGRDCDCDDGCDAKTIPLVPLFLWTRLLENDCDHANDDDYGDDCDHVSDDDCGCDSYEMIQALVQLHARRCSSHSTCLQQSYLIRAIHALQTMQTRLSTLASHSPSHILFASTFSGIASFHKLHCWHLLLRDGAADMEGNRLHRSNWQEAYRLLLH